MTLPKKYGSGFSKSNLNNMRRFYPAYPAKQTTRGPDGSSCVLLPAVKDEKKRGELEKRAVKEKPGCRELKKRVIVDFHTPRNNIRIDMYDMILYIS
jgi:hypothetical protein